MVQMIDTKVFNNSRTYKKNNLGNFSSHLTSKNSYIDECIKEASEKYNVPADLIHAVARVESGYNNNAVSSAKARGIMQLMPCAIKDLGIDNPYSVKGNIDGGAKMLSYLLDRYDGRVDSALSAYNAGIGRVDKKTGYCSLECARNYVKKVLGILNVENNISNNNKVIANNDKVIANDKYTNNLQDQSNMIAKLNSSIKNNIELEDYERVNILDNNKILNDDLSMIYKNIIANNIALAIKVKDFENLELLEFGGSENEL